MTKKYDINAEGRVVALRDFGDVKVGDVGGFVESEKNLSHECNCWVSGDATVCGDAIVYGNATVCGDAQVYGGAQVSGNARVYGNTHVYGNAQVFEDVRVSGNATVCGDAQVSGNARVYGNTQVSGDAQVFGDARVYGDVRVSGNALVRGNALVSGNMEVYGIMRSDGFCFCFVPCSDGNYRVIAGCRYFTMPEAREHWGTEHPQHEETSVILDALESLSKVKRRVVYDKRIQIQILNQFHGSDQL